MTELEIKKLQEVASRLTKEEHRKQVKEHEPEIAKQMAEIEEREYEQFILEQKEQEELEWELGNPNVNDLTELIPGLWVGNKNGINSVINFEGNVILRPTESIFTEDIQSEKKVNVKTFAKK